MRRLTVAGALGLGLLFGLADQAGADAGAVVVTDSGGIGHGAHNSGSSTGSGSGGGGSESPCTYVAVSISPAITVWYDDGAATPVDGTGQWYEKRCEGGVFGGVFYIRPVDPTVLLADAWRYLAVPSPEPGLSPAGDQIANLPTWLWVDPAGWGPQRSTVAVPGVSVTVIAEPIDITWAFGDGTSITCAGPGTAYDPRLSLSAQRPTCSHTFRRSTASMPAGSIAAAVTVRWQASWTVAGAAGGGDLGEIERTTDFSVRVGEVQAINTARR